LRNGRPGLLSGGIKELGISTLLTEKIVIEQILSHPLKPPSPTDDRHPASGHQERIGHEIFYVFGIILALCGTVSAQELVAGSYTCRVVGSSKVSDGRSSYIQFRSGSIKVTDDGAVRMTSKATFSVRGRSPRVETLSVVGQGELSEYSENDGDATASTSFRVTPVKRVVHRGRVLSGAFTAEFSAQETVLGSAQTATAVIRTQVGAFRLVCAG
jgi:hypothetical protein